MKFDHTLFSNELFKLRKKRFQTLDDVSFATKISSPHLWRIENGQAKNPDMKTVLSVCTWMNKPINNFIKN